MSSPSSLLPPGVVSLSVSPPHFSRLLYSNPVCFLSASLPPSALPALKAMEEEIQDKPQVKRLKSSSSTLSLRSVQSVSWLTSLDNHGNFLLSLNQTRYTSHFIRLRGEFSLSIACEGHENLLRKIGKISGRNQDKVRDFKIQICKLGWNKIEDREEIQGEMENERDVRLVDFQSAPLFFVSSSVAHLHCSVREIITNHHLSPAHYLVFAHIDDAAVRSDYWQNGLLAPVHHELPALLSFLGNGTFAAQKIINKDNKQDDNIQSEKEEENILKENKLIESSQN
jgi:flavin reductase (DIM6/NTAB) family NADH-FMN oxidoreductase RutF